MIKNKNITTHTQSAHVFMYKHTINNAFYTASVVPF